MSSRFSEKLISDITDYFKKRQNIEITVNQAEAFLLSLADLYLAMARVNQRRIDG